MTVFFGWLKSPYLLIVLALIIAVWYCWGYQLSFVNIREIIRMHNSIFGDGKVHYFFFVGVPLLLAIALVRLRTIDVEIIENINIVLSILITMMFTILGLLNVNRKDDRDYKIVLQETYASTNYAIFQIIFMMVISFGCLFLDMNNVGTINIIISFILYYGIFSVILTFFIIAKRLGKLLDIT